MTRRIQPIPAEATRPLRQRILRPHQHADALVYPGDDAPTTLHLGVFEEDQLVGVLTVSEESPSETGEAHAWRMRGVAVEKNMQGAGYGGALLEAAIEYVKAQGGKFLWCNARSNVRGYYERYNFQVRGDEFSLPDIGPHYFMFLNLP